MFTFEGGLLIPNKGDSLSKFFNRLTPDTEDTIGNISKSFDEFLEKGGIDKNFINSLPDDDALKTSLRRKYDTNLEFATEVIAARQQGQGFSDAIRNSMARKFLETTAQKIKMYLVHQMFMQWQIKLIV